MNNPQKQQLRKLFQQIYKAKNTKIIPEEQLTEILQKEKSSQKPKQNT